MICRGAGPVGILAAQCCFARGAKRVILIDNQEYRLKRALAAMPQLETINFNNKATLDQLKELVPHGARHAFSPAVNCLNFQCTAEAIWPQAKGLRVRLLASYCNNKKTVCRASEHVVVPRGSYAVSDHSVEVAGPDVCIEAVGFHYAQ